MRTGDKLVYQVTITNMDPKWSKPNSTSGTQTVTVSADSRKPRYGVRAFKLQSHLSLPRLKEYCPKDTYDYLEQAADGTIYCLGAVGLRFTSVQGNPVWFKSPMSIGQAYSWVATVRQNIRVRYSIKVTQCAVMDGVVAYKVHRSLTQTGKAPLNMDEWFAPELGYSLRTECSFKQGTITSTLTSQLQSRNF